MFSVRLSMPFLFLFAFILAGCNVTHPTSSGSKVPVTTAGVTTTPSKSKPAKNKTPMAEVKEAKPINLKQLTAKAAKAVDVKSQKEASGKTILLFLDKLKNSTTANLDTDGMTSDLHAALAKTGHFRMIPLTQTMYYQQSLEYQQNEGNFNPSTAVRLGKQTGADWILYGHIVKKKSQYELEMEMLDLKSSEILFSDKQRSSK